MNGAHSIWSAALCGSMFLSACGDSGGGAPSASGAKPAGSAAGGTSAKPSAKPSATAPASAATSATAATSSDAPPTASGSAPPAGSAAAGGGANPLPADLAKLTDAIKDGVELKDPKLDGFFFNAPKGAKLESAPAPGAWSTITVDGAKLAFLAHAASDGGDGCPKLADMKAKAKGAKDVLSASSKMKPWGKKSLGDNVDFWMFEKDGKFGFYGVKTFEGKDKTSYCCAPGEQADAEAMKPVVDKAKAETLAGVCLSLVQKL